MKTTIFMPKCSEDSDVITLKILKTELNKIIKEAINDKEEAALHELYLRAHDKETEIKAYIKIHEMLRELEEPPKHTTIQNETFWYRTCISNEAFESDPEGFKELIKSHLLKSPEFQKAIRDDIKIEILKDYPDTSDKFIEASYTLYKVIKENDHVRKQDNF